jgi:hypothetical protein
MVAQEVSMLHFVGIIIVGVAGRLAGKIMCGIGVRRHRPDRLRHPGRLPAPHQEGAAQDRLTSPRP